MDMSRVLAFDSGAERMGWAALEGDGESQPIYLASGIEKFPIGKKKYQVYKLELIEHWAQHAPHMFAFYAPDYIVAETVPAVGFNNTTQAELAKAAIITVMAIAYDRFIPVRQIAAVTVKKRITGDNKASKVKVRNGVIDFLPELAPRRFEWQDSKKTMDEPDAIGVGLAELGYTVNKVV